MSGPSPKDIWHESLDEGERRLARSRVALGATGFAGGVDMFFSILILAVVSGSLATMMVESAAHSIAALTFGIGFVFITLGRAELFTENFLVPVGAVVARRGSAGALLRMWVITMFMNFVGLALFAWIFSESGVLEKEALDAAGTLADTIALRESWPAFLSAVAAGTIMTLFTWVVAATEDRTAAVLASYLARLLGDQRIHLPKPASGYA